MFIASGSVSLANGTFFGNSANEGGAAGTSTVIRNINTILASNNGGDSAGGGLFVSGGSVKLLGFTMASNNAKAGGTGHTQGSSLGGGIANAGATSFATNTTLIGNNTRDSSSSGEGPDISGAVTSAYSLIRQTAGASITDNGHNLLDVAPMLDPGGLHSNGGPTQTVALVQGSPADGTGNNSICQEAAPTGLGGIDQRGFPRFRPGDELCDIGAFEFVTLLVQPFQPASLSFGSAAVGHQTPAQKVSITNNQTRPVTLSRSITGADPADFIIISNTCGGSLASHASSSILIAFHPRATGTRSAMLTVSDSPDRTSPYHVMLTGVGR